MSSNGSTPETGHSRPRVSLVITTLNESTQLPELLESIDRQSVRPAEVIVVDGGSTDDSLSILDAWRPRLPLTVFSRPGANISAGRNAGIARAGSEIIAITDAGVRLAPDWLEHLIAPLLQDLLSVDIVGGFFQPDPRSGFETALAATTLPDAREIAPERFLPSSRSLAFRRSWFMAGVRYPEWLDYCEDLIFDLRMQRAGARFSFQPRAIVQFRPRTSLEAFWSQYYRYARGDGKAGLFFRRHLARYVTYLVVLPSVFLTRSWLVRALVVLGAAAYMRKPVQRLSRRCDRPMYRMIPMVALTVGLRAIGDAAKMAGYPVGLIWRARRYGLRANWRNIVEDEGDCSQEE